MFEGGFSICSIAERISSVVGMVYSPADLREQFSQMPWRLLRYRKQVVRASSSASCLAGICSGSFCKRSVSERCNFSVSSIRKSSSSMMCPDLIRNGA